MLHFSPILQFCLVGCTIFNSAVPKYICFVFGTYSSIILSSLTFFLVHYHWYNLADIAGFTAWSSTREPEQVFHLLETVYGAIDQIAMHRGIFKVETVGDCYVAVCGLPDPREDHAIAMVRFARDCQLRMASLSQQLEVALGPDTADLAFR